MIFMQSSVKNKDVSSDPAVPNLFLEGMMSAPSGMDAQRDVNVEFSLNLLGVKPV